MLLVRPQPLIEQENTENSLSPSTDASSAPTSLGSDQPQKLPSVPSDASHEDRARLRLPQHLQYYLDYHKTQLTLHHYKSQHDANHLLYHILIGHALIYEPLLNAVAGFAAFQFSVQWPSGKTQHFLGNHNRSVSLLRKSPGDDQRHTDARMLIFLQLATHEVNRSYYHWTETNCRYYYRGDWVNLLGHQ